MLKPSEELFKFPTRIYDPVELDHDEWLSDINNKPPEREVKEFAIAWKRVQIEDIRDWNETFARGRTIANVKKNGCDATLVTVGNEDYICDWDMKTFEKEYDKHFKRLMKQSRDIINEELEEEFITHELIKQLQQDGKQTTEGDLQGEQGKLI